MTLNYTAIRPARVAPFPCGRNDRQMGATPSETKCFMLKAGSDQHEGERMADYWIWWVLAAVLVGLELVTGTFYLLAVGVAFALGGLAAVLGTSLPVQMLIGSVSAAAGTFAAHRWRETPALPVPRPALALGE